MFARTQDKPPELMVTKPPEGRDAGPSAARTGGPLLTVLGDRAKIEGRFQIADSLEIECEIGGELEIGGRLVVGTHGVVRADVRTVDALIMGTYQGNLVATGSVEIANTGRVIGNIRTDSLVIEKGGFFNGTVHGIEEDASGDAAPAGVKVEKVMDPVGFGPRAPNNGKPGGQDGRKGAGGGAARASAEDSGFLARASATEAEAGRSE